MFIKSSSESLQRTLIYEFEYDMEKTLYTKSKTNTKKVTFHGMKLEQKYTEEYIPYWDCVRKYCKHIL